MNPQIFGVVMDRLYAAGALEVFYVPVQMKKNRPGTLLTVVAPPASRADDCRTSSSAKRRRSACGTTRSIASACSGRSVTVETPIGAVRFKVARRDGRVDERRRRSSTTAPGWRPPTICRSKKSRRSRVKAYRIERS